MHRLREEQRAPRLVEVASAIGMSVATLRRRLVDQNASYRQIKDSCRRELALKMLRHSDLPIEEIANRLDYGDSDTFRRAFRTWMGASPSRFRGEQGLNTGSRKPN
jgi:AraC-like DNA-binding protein